MSQFRFSSKLRFVVTALAMAGVLTMAGHASADTLTWDANSSTAGVQAGDGIWSTSADNWQDVAPNNVVWTQGDNADILAGSGTITLGEDITASINSRTGTKYTFDGDAYTLTLLGITSNNTSNQSFTFNVPIQISGSVSAAGGALTFNKAITETAANSTLTLNGDITLAVANTISGGVTLTGGSLTLDSDGAVGTGHLGIRGHILTNGQDRTIANDVSWDYGLASNSSSYGFGGGAKITFTDATPTVEASGTNQFAVDSGTTVEFTGAFSTSNRGDLGFDKRGGGVLIFAGDNSNTADNIVTEGTLVIDGDTTGQGNYTVNGGTLGGNGTIGLADGNTVTVASGGHLAPGASVGTLTISGDADLQSGGAFDFEIGDAGSSDVLNVANLTLAGDLNLSQLLGTTASGTYTLVQYSGSLSGAFANITGTPIGYALDYGSGTNSQITLTVAPEPASGALALMGLAALLMLPRRHRMPG